MSNSYVKHNQTKNIDKQYCNSIMFHTNCVINCYKVVPRISNVTYNCTQKVQISKYYSDSHVDIQFLEKCRHDIYFSNLYTRKRYFLRSSIFLSIIISIRFLSANIFVSSLLFILISVSFGPFLTSPCLLII